MEFHVAVAFDQHVSHEYETRKPKVSEEAAISHFCSPLEGTQDSTFRDAYLYLPYVNDPMAMSP